MIQSTFKIAVLLILFCGASYNYIDAASPNSYELVKKTEFTKNINKEFSISANGDVSLANKYGKVDLKTWSQNKVKIDITITVDARNQSNADDIFERIKVHFDNGADFVSAQTEIESTKKSYWGDGKGEFRIDYEVHMPKSCDLNLSNKYGHSFVEEIDGKANVEVKYGDLSMDGVNNECTVSLGYGNGTIVKAGRTSIDVKYSKIKVNEADDVNVSSKYSKVYIDEAGDIKSTSKYDSYRLGNLQEFKNEGKYDHFEIDNVNLIHASSKYSDYNVEQLAKEGVFSLEYGNVVIGELLKSFSSMRLDGKYTDFKIKIEEGTDYSLDVVAQYANVKYPANMEVTHEYEKHSKHEVRGHSGSASSSPIKARINYGGIKVYGGGNAR